MPEQKTADLHGDDINVIKDWLVKQPHLPSNVDVRFIRRFLHCCDYSLEKTKTLIDLSFTVRSQAPEIFSCRDPGSFPIQNTLKITDMVPLPILTSQKYKLFIYRLADFDPDKYIFADALKTFLTVADVRLVHDPEYPEGEVPIFDMVGFTLRHVSKLTLPLLKKYMVYTQEAHPVRLKQIHLVNVPPFLDKVLTILKPFMRSEVANMLHYHLPNSKTLYDYVPRELLPEEYGGSVGKLSDIKDGWVKTIMEHREYLLDESRWRVDETKRPFENKNGKQLFGMQGSFRSLSID